ncbi:type VI secretion system accessory protein TagJ [Pseudoduganella sp. SL102]|uniref:type VI secretion system accessory protein TagJ n=1 Tax=Pseudoduganella sp. SL102 TaxID=2995154 RepID=UPI00248AF142|nr:type VI secretion system accessory protein TagJ [Pseudoduganella sp. SL102]WBS00597.1 type VI secretion system accessory protein TagJ [Pseudoduganella sp. SL102]
MNGLAAAEESLRDGDPGMALQQLQALVRNAPGDPKLRIFLFQLLAVLGQWERALTQLGVAAELDASALAMREMYGAAVRCEVQRARVFEGGAAPMVLGQPEQWLALLIESLLMTGQGQGQGEGAAALRRRAYDEAAPSGGTIDGTPFAWIADGDSRLGPVLEAIIDGKYYWVPFTRFSEIAIEAPEDLRDAVWMPAHLRFANGGETVGLIPTRYPALGDDGLLLLSRKTAWHEAAPGTFHGLGQRMFVTDAGETPLMDIRRIVFDALPEAAAGED